MLSNSFFCDMKLEKKTKIDQYKWKEPKKL